MTRFGRPALLMAMLLTGAAAPALAQQDTVPAAALVYREVRLLQRPGRSLQWGTVGMLVGPVVGYRVALWQANHGAHASHEEDGFVAFLLGVPAGALLGAIVGAELGRARWREVRIRR